MRWDRTLNSFGFGSYPLTSNGQNQVYLNPAWKLYTHGREILDLIHPVGSIYISLDSTDPSQIFGGTWEQITGRFLLAAGHCGQNTDTSFGNINSPGGWNAPPGTTGGEDFHTLNLGEIPAHDHGILSGFGDVNDPAIDSDGFRYAWWGGNNRGYHNAFISSSGGGGRHNNMPPYFSVYMWRRTA